jgi:hypothetical protein
MVIKPSFKLSLYTGGGRGMVVRVWKIKYELVAELNDDEGEEFFDFLHGHAPELEDYAHFYIPKKEELEEGRRDKEGEEGKVKKWKKFVREHDLHDTEVLLTFDSS